MRRVFLLAGEVREGQLSHTYTLSLLISSFETHSPECRNWLGVGQLSCSYAPRTSFPTMPREEWGQLCTGLRCHQHILGSIPGSSAIAFGANRPCCCRVINPDMGTQRQHRVGPHYGARWCHQLFTSVPHYPRVFTSASLPCFCFSFSFVSPPLPCSS